MDFKGLKVKTIVGAQLAYACIELPGYTLDVALQPGKSAANSLAETANENREKALKLLKRAQVMEAAARDLDPGVVIQSAEL